MLKGRLYKESEPGVNYGTFCIVTMGSRLGALGIKILESSIRDAGSYLAGKREICKQEDRFKYDLFLRTIRLK